MSSHLINTSGNTVDSKKCEKVEPPHPCDPQLPCDPEFQANSCPTPYICQERLRNPAWPGEITRCKPGAFMPVKSCAKVDPPHPCDVLPGCSLKTEHEKKKKLTCLEPPLCAERIKNVQDRKKLDPSCDSTK